MKGKTLVTGFGPFGPHKENPAGEVLALLGAEVKTMELPVSYRRAPAQLEALIRQEQPRRILCLGLAASRQALSIERVALNLADAVIPDNWGDVPVDERLVEGGDLALAPDFPVRRAWQTLQDAGFPARLSESAGTFVCNAVFYRLCELQRLGVAGEGVFVHLPPVARIPLAKQAEAVQLIMGV